jgi:hypothetical protein
MTGGLSETSLVPRNRIELLTRGFSVQPSLLLDMLAHLAALGRIAEELGRAMGGSQCDPDARIAPQLARKTAPSEYSSGNASSRKRLLCPPPADLRPGSRRRFPG